MLLSKIPKFDSNSKIENITYIKTTSFGLIDSTVPHDVSAIVDRRKIKLQASSLFIFLFLSFFNFKVNCVSPLSIAYQSLA